MARSELEKRLRNRYPPTLYVSVYDGDTEDFFGLLADLSRTGFRVSSKNDLSVDRDYNLAIKNPFSKSSETLNCFVVKAVWCEQNKDGLFDTGFKFVSFEDESEDLFKRMMEDFAETAKSINRIDK